MWLIKTPRSRSRARIAAATTTPTLFNYVTKHACCKYSMGGADHVYLKISGGIFHYSVICDEDFQSVHLFCPAWG